MCLKCAHCFCEEHAMDHFQRHRSHHHMLFLELNTEEKLVHWYDTNACGSNCVHILHVHVM